MVSSQLVPFLQQFLSSYDRTWLIGRIRKLYARNSALCPPSPQPRWWLCPEYWVIFWTNCHNPIFAGTCAGCWPRAPPLIRALTNIVKISEQWSSPGSDPSLTPFLRLCIFTQSRFLSSFNLPGKCQEARVRKWVLIDDDQVWLQQDVQGIISNVHIYMGECWL